MKTLEANFQAALSAQVTSITWCWLLELEDGAKLGFTSFDLPLVIDSITYEPSTGFAPTSDKTSEGSKEADSQALQGILTSDRITEGDLRSGRYNYAKITCFNVNVTELPANLSEDPPRFLNIYEGSLGKVKHSDRGFEIEVRKLDYFLETEIGRTTSKTCSHDLGDSKCGVDLPTNTINVEVDIVYSQYDILFVGAGWTDNDFKYGVGEFTTGLNLGIKRDVAGNIGTRVSFFQPFPYAINGSDRINLTFGCDKTMYRCLTKFNNIVNGDHEPHIPTQDQAIATPGNN